MATARKRRMESAADLTPEEWWRDFDQYARTQLSMTGAEFIRKYDAGEIDVDDPEFHTRYVRLEMLLPFVRGVAPRT